MTGTLSVTASNSCGTGTAKTLAVTAKPAVPGAVTGPTTVCANQQGVAYSIAAVPSATSYTWTGPTGSHISDGVATSSGTTLTTSSTSVTVNYGSSAGSLKVKANNACGTSSTRTINITFNCKAAGENTNNFNIEVYPNPAEGIIKVSFTSDKHTLYDIRLADISGRILYTKSVYSLIGINIQELDLSEFSKGIYFLSVRTPSENVEHQNKSQLVKVVLQ